MSDAKLRKISLVIEDTGEHEGKGFKFYMEGDKERLSSLADDDLGPAEFYGKHLFVICTGILNKGPVAALIKGEIQ